MPDIATGTDGATSVPATRTLTSGSSDFDALGVQLGDILHLEDDTDTGDNDRYVITAVSTTILTVDKDWPVGSLTNLSFRVQSIRQQFSTTTPDQAYLKRQDRNAAWHLYTPRQWWVLNQLTEPERNIYGEPVVRTTVTASDGVTSVPATRTLTTSTDLVAAGVRPLDTLAIADSSTPGDDGWYQIDAVTTNTVTINEDWPVGSLTGLDFTIEKRYHEYTPFPTLVPFYIRLDPPASDLKKYGIEQERDFLGEISVQVCEEVGLLPKIGDRFDVNTSEGNIQQFQLLTFDAVPISGDMRDPLHYFFTGLKSKYKHT